MTDRDRLIEIFNSMDREPGITCPNFNTDKSCRGCKHQIGNENCNFIERKVDYLLANGVIVLEKGEWIDNHNGTYTCSVCGGKSSKMDYCGRCGAKLKESENADLINRLQAENERLKEKIVADDKLLNDRVQEAVNAVSIANQKYVDALEQALKEKATEIDELENHIKTLKTIIRNTFLSKAGLVADPLAEIKAEAYKEFAERLKEKTKVNNLGDGFVYLGDINNLLKEMAGDKECS